MSVRLRGSLDARRTAFQLVLLLVAGVAFRRYRAWRLASIALLPNRLVRARGLTRRNVQRAADPRQVGVW